MDLYLRRSDKGYVTGSISSSNTIANWQKLVAAKGQTAVSAFARFCLIPGKGHGEGLFNAKVDMLSALEAWVEQGTAAKNLVASGGNTAAASVATNGRTRPLCEYGTYPKYTGSASPSQSQMNDAANFTCTAY